MKTIWLVYPYGPIIGETFLEARYVRFGRVLAREGYNVVWWTTNFSHTFKRKRSKGEKDIQVCDGFVIKMVPTPSYKSNISLGRVNYEVRFSQKLKRKWKKETSPDLIITAGTGLMTAYAPVKKYAKDKSIPIVYDIMDVHMFDSYMKEHHKLLFPAAKVVSKITAIRERGFYRQVSAVSALGRNQLDVAVNRTGNSEIPRSLVYNGIDVSGFRKLMGSPCSVSLPEKEEGWIWCVYAGSLGPSYDIDSILDCASKVKENGDKIKFIMVGAGPQEDAISQAAEMNDRIYYVGAVKPEELPAIYSRCDIGLSTYAAYSTVDMPDKFYDYCAAGLAVVNSLTGEIKDYIVNNNLGRQYKADDSDSLYRAIKEVSGDELETLKKNAYQMGEVFDFNTQMKPFVEMIANII